MDSIQGSGFPLAFKARGHRLSSADDAVGRTRIRTLVRALEGMQKEAIVSPGGGAAWRMVCDEGHYLKGTDLAPPPLDFFAAGLAFSLMARAAEESEARGATLRGLKLTQDTRYSISGSFLRGDAAAGAFPAEATLAFDTDASAEVLEQIARNSEVRCPAHALMRQAMNNQFSATINGRRVNLQNACDAPGFDPFAEFQSLKAANNDQYLPGIITKLETATARRHAEGGVGVGLQHEQKRNLHLHVDAQRREDGVFEAVLRVILPIGSTFKVLCDPAGRLAPTPEAYWSAGVGFCFMTQLGRYAHIRRRRLDRYAIVQDAAFTTGPPASVEPLITHAFFEADIDDAAARDMIETAERTCFLHASMRGSYPSVIQFETGVRDVESQRQLG